MIASVLLVSAADALAQARIKYLLQSGYASQNLAYQDVRREDLLDSRDLARLGDRR